MKYHHGIMSQLYDMALRLSEKESSQVIGRYIEDITLPEGAAIGVVCRDDQVLMAHHDTVIQDNDHVIIFLSNKKKIPEIERLFQTDMMVY